MIVAIAILSTAAVSAVALGAECARAVERAREADARTRRASAFLDAVALWTREALDRHLGARPQGPWRMTVDRPVPALYRVLLADSSGGGTVLETALYRPEPSHAQP